MSGRHPMTSSCCWASTGHLRYRTTANAAALCLPKWADPARVGECLKALTPYRIGAVVMLPGARKPIPREALLGLLRQYGFEPEPSAVDAPFQLLLRADRPGATAKVAQPGTSADLRRDSPCSARQRCPFAPVAREPQPAVRDRDQRTFDGAVRFADNPSELGIHINHDHSGPVNDQGRCSDEDVTRTLVLNGIWTNVPSEGVHQVSLQRLSSRRRSSDPVEDGRNKYPGVF